MLYVFQHAIIFPAASYASNGKLPANVQLRWLQRLSDDKDFRILVALPEKEPIRGVAVFFGGNGEHLDSLAHWRLPSLTAYGLMVISPEYPGYGESSGPLDKSLFLEQAEIATRMANREADARGIGGKPLPLVVIGSSLGTFSAMHVSSLGFGSHLLLHAPLRSLDSVAVELYWFIPVKLFLKDEFRFDNEAAVAKLRLRTDLDTLVIHGDKDTIVPQTHGRWLYNQILYRTDEAAPTLHKFYTDPVAGAVTACDRHEVSGVCSEPPSSPAVDTGALASSVKVIYKHRLVEWQ